MARPCEHPNLKKKYAIPGPTPARATRAKKVFVVYSWTRRSHLHLKSHLSKRLAVPFFLAIHGIQLCIRRVVLVVTTKFI
eukprot:SAG31_NODE_6775_length_1892_cov_21.724484_3_plen_80_part_00